MLEFGSASGRVLESGSAYVLECERSEEQRDRKRERERENVCMKRQRDRAQEREREKVARKVVPSAAEAAPAASADGQQLVPSEALATS